MEDSEGEFTSEGKAKGPSTRDLLVGGTPVAADAAVVVATGAAAKLLVAAVVPFNSETEAADIGDKDEDDEEDADVGEARRGGSTDGGWTVRRDADGSSSTVLLLPREGMGGGASTGAETLLFTLTPSLLAIASALAAVGAVEGAEGDDVEDEEDDEGSEEMEVEAEVEEDGGWVWD